jgi:ABC-type lipoprotein export system ATPase subunit
MTLTVVVGSSGSGKTTFLNDVHKYHKCTYIRQYHNLRPYVTVSKIPNFDPTSLPFWDIYVREGTASSIKAGGTMAGEFTAGLSGGQRKLLMFELIFQRTSSQSELLIVLDEPFAGVTDDFVPWITGRLEEMSKKHNILLVTNDHVETMTKMSDNTITVSAIDRSNVCINDKPKVDRQKAILALSIGEEYKYSSNTADLKFFYDVEIHWNDAILVVVGFTVFSFGLFLISYWDAEPDTASLVFVAGLLISFFSINPYLLSLPDWRNFMTEEAEALLHSSKDMNKFLKSSLVIVLILVISIAQFGCTIAVVDGFNTWDFWFAVFINSLADTFSFICIGLYTTCSHQLTETLALMPFLFMMLFSTTFSPGSGLPGIKELRYLFSRFYFWCMIPDVQGFMEGCPEDSALNLVYMTLSGLVPVAIFLVALGVSNLISRVKQQKEASERATLRQDEEFKTLQEELIGGKTLRRFTARASEILASAKADAMASTGDDDEDDEA